LPGGDSIGMILSVGKVWRYKRDNQNP